MIKNVASLRSRGFTLIELMVVVAVVAILVGIAIPSYTESVRKGRRGDAKAALVETAQIAERYRTVNGTFTGISNTVTGIAKSPKQGDAAYDVVITGTDTTFTATATPTTGGPQVGDRCGVLTLNELGEKNHSTGDDSQCQFGTTGP